MRLLVSLREGLQGYSRSRADVLFNSRPLLWYRRSRVPVRIQYAVAWRLYVVFVEIGSGAW